MINDKIVKSPIKILVLGQIPPPTHGQSIMIHELIKANYDQINIFHIPLKYSKTLGEIGRFRFYKIFELCRVVCKSIWYLQVHRYTILYYPPAGHRQEAIIRDIITLLCVRPFTKKLIFHFHAFGLFEAYGAIPNIISFLFRKAYFRPDACICLAKENVSDTQFLLPKKIYITPYGIVDYFKSYAYTKKRSTTEPVSVLFVGNLIESKGVGDLLDAVLLLYHKEYDLTVTFIGGFQSNEFEKKILQHPLAKDSRIKFMGIQTGESKWNQYNKADIFCFPTYYESENFSVVLLEAMQFELPIITTRWRGIPSIIDDGINGFLIEPHSQVQIKDRLEMLLNDKVLRERIGKNARKKYLEKFTLEKYLKSIENVFVEVAETPRS